MPGMKTILDVDIGVDDCLALLLAFASPELDIAAVTPSFGNTSAAHVSSNLNKLFYLLQQELESDSYRPGSYPVLEGIREGKRLKIVVPKSGASQPIEGELEMAEYFHGPDGLSDIGTTRPEFNPPSSFSSSLFESTDQTSSELILDLLRSEEAGSVTLIALGPLTNVALAQRADPSAFSRVKRVLWMGGTVDAPGNTSPNAEFNCYADPYAAAAVFKESLSTSSHPFSLTICPLDITTPHVVAFPLLMPPSPPSSRPTSIRKFVSAFLQRVRTLYADLGLGDAMEMHDPATVWWAICLAQGEDVGGPEGWKVASRQLAVERTGELTRGMVVVDRRGTTETSLEVRTHGGIHHEDRVESDPSSASAPGVKILVGTPGPAAFEKMFLERLVSVFGP